MRLISFEQDGVAGVGVMIGDDGFVDLATAEAVLLIGAAATRGQANVGLEFAIGDVEESADTVAALALGDRCGAVAGPVHHAHAALAELAEVSRVTIEAAEQCR